MNVINNLEDDNSVEHVEEEEEEKDERYYLQDKKALEKVEVIDKLRLHIEEARSLRQDAVKIVAQTKEDTHNNLHIAEMHIVAIVDFC